MFGPVTAWTILFAGVGVWLLLEGALYAAFPDLLRRLGVLLSRLTSEEVRSAGLWSAALGAIILYIALRFS